MEQNYSETLNKAKTYFKNMIKEREKYMQQITLDLPKRIEIQTLPLTTSQENGGFTKTIEKHNKPETKQHHEPEKTTNTKQKSGKKKSSHHTKSPHVKIQSFELRNMSNNTELESSKNKGSSNTIIESLSISTTDSPISTSLKISTSSSTARINQKCQDAIEKAKNYFKTKDKSHLKQTSPNTKKVTKVNESTSTKADENNQPSPDNVVNGDTIKTNNAEEHETKKERKNSHNQKITCFDALTPAKKYLRSKLGIDQKSINVKKEKALFSHSKTHMYRFATKIKTFPNATKESKKTITQKDTSRPESPNNQSPEKTTEHLTPAKRYLRSKLGFDEKTTTIKKDNTKPLQNAIVQETAVNTETQTAEHSESSAKPSTKPHSTNPVKVRQPISIRPVSRSRETNIKKLSAANEVNKKEKYRSKSTKEKGNLSTKTNIVTDIEPGSRETNKISIELRRSIVLTNSMEELLSKALRIGLKKVNRSDLQDLQLRIKASAQSRNNISGLEPSIISEKSDLASMQSILESKISDFQTEMERRQKHTFDKIQELENTIQFRKQQLMEINKTKNAALKKHEK